jgi:hypothetical protein
MTENSSKVIRRETRRTIDSGAQIFLSIAMRNYYDFLKQTPNPASTFRYEELAINSFTYCFLALEAHINDIYIAKRGPNLTTDQFDTWQKKNVRSRLGDLFHSKVMSKRRADILTEVIEFRNALTHPVPIVERETRDILEENTVENGIVSYVASIVDTDIEIARAKFSKLANILPLGYRYTNLPPHPFKLNKEQLQCCLLVLLEWFVLTERKFKKWGGWPFYGSYGQKKVQTVVDWFEQIRIDYRGTLRPRFDRIEINSAKYR